MAGKGLRASGERSMLNKVMIIGRLGRDPELRYIQGSGTPVATLNVATDDSYIDRDGNRVNRTEWHRISVFQRTAENCSAYLKKGSLVYVEGSLRTRKYQDQQGQDRYVTEIHAQRVVFLDKKSDGAGGDGFQGQRGGYQQQRQGYGPRGGQQNNRPQPDAAPAPQNGPDNGREAEEDLGSPFPGEANMDNVPF